ncbi:MAG: D-isomer specific 2-hydroxyacid dehydrogenase family protein [Sulfolobales archaeon]|nr:D-isomer specific 2-hydroxyacid dehydrogenase family protein [Sulfolobales archaeon]MCX8186718.1 D-isomer specific 2-hydroxyacid dehydrogenase family protein [Sulfolobales archaeon]MDW7969709.1 D-isomer specific 2-hydroxyacid dehydrogenase family protein [Sulfolobales archaeon]
MNSNLRIAVVNSKTFGLYSNVINDLKSFAVVDRLEVPKDLSGFKLASLLKDYDIIIASVTPKYDEEFFKSNPRVKMISRHGIGVDNVDVDAATKYGVVVTKVPGYVERNAVAEHAVTLMLAALRSVVNAHMKVATGNWGERGKFVCSELKYLTVGLIGIGNIGSRVAEIITKGFGCKVIAYDPYVPETVAREVGAALVDLNTLLSTSDIISIHTPLTSETYHLIDWDKFSVMKKGVIIVNTARGEIIDTDALIKAINEGIVGAVALDVVEGEPIDSKHPLLKFGNVIITPHIAAFTYQGLRGMDESVLKAIKDYLNGLIPEGIVNKEVYERGLRRN